MNANIRNPRQNCKCCCSPDPGLEYGYDLPEPHFHLSSMTYSGTDPRGIKWNSLIPIQKVGELNLFMIKEMKPFSTFLTAIFILAGTKVKLSRPEHLRMFSVLPVRNLLLTL